MRPLRRILATVLIGAALAVLFFAPAQAFTVTGGTPEQRADVHATLAAVQFPSVEWVESKVGPVRIEILDHYEPYWFALGVDDDVLVDVFSATAAGVAWPANIRIAAAYTPGARTFFREIVSHEFSHQVWFALLYVPGSTAEWRERVEAGHNADSSDWFQNYVESHSEQLRVAAWGPLYWMTPYARTNLNLLGDAAVREFHDRWINGGGTTSTTAAPTTTTTTATAPTTTTTAPPPTTTTTAPRGDPFPDVVRSTDEELWQAAWWGWNAGIIWGYSDGTFGPYDTLTRRHAVLMIGRAGGAVYPQWVFDYGIPTRGELAALYPDYVWDSERWSETLLRSQLLRLMFRGAQ